MANLVIDIGNTYTKVAVFDNDELIYTSQHQAFDTDTLNNYLNNYSVKRAILSTVKNKTEGWQDTIKQPTLFDLILL